MRGNRFFGSGALASSELVAAELVAPELVAAGFGSAIPAVSGVSVAASAAASPIGTQRRTAKRGHTRMDDPV